MSRKIKTNKLYNIFIMDNFFCDRLRYLRNERKISAREMSLALGQNETYINKIETGQRSVSMEGFFKICNYLEVSPATFFDESIHNTRIDSQELLSAFRKLNSNQAEYLFALIQDLLS